MSTFGTGRISLWFLSVPGAFPPQPWLSKIEDAQAATIVSGTVQLVPVGMNGQADRSASTFASDGLTSQIVVRL